MPRVTSSSAVISSSDRLPRLVERAPADDAGMRVVALQHLQPLGDVVRPGLLMLAVQRPHLAAAPVAELAPHDVAQPVGVVEEALLEDLLVQPRAVEARGLAQLDVADQRLVAGRGHDAVRVVALVEHQPLEDGLAVDLDGLAVDGDAAQAGVALHAVHHRAVGVQQLDLADRTDAGRRSTTAAGARRGSPGPAAATGPGPPRTSARTTSPSCVAERRRAGVSPGRLFGDRLLQPDHAVRPRPA